MNHKGIQGIPDASTKCGKVTDHQNVMPITPFSSSIQTPGTSSSAGTASTIHTGNISREEIIGSENAQRSALSQYEIHRPKPKTCSEFFGAEFVRNPDGTPLLDHENEPITIAKMLATKPLKSELHSRPGPGNRKLTYLSGDSVTRTLNDIFGFDGWCLEVKETRRECCEKDSKDRYCVSYTSLVRVTHRQSGAFKEDCGAGDCVDKSLGTAISHALKASVTDAMKRAVRHFGDKLGNSLYESSFTMNNAPKSLKDALIQYEIERAKCKFGFEKDRVKVEPLQLEGLQEEGEGVLEASRKEPSYRTTTIVPQDVKQSSVAPATTAIAIEYGLKIGASMSVVSNTVGMSTQGGVAVHPTRNLDHGNARHQVTNIYKRSDFSNQNKSSTSAITNTNAATKNSSFTSSEPTIKNEAPPQQIHADAVANPSMTSNISPNGIKRFQQTNTTATTSSQIMPGAINNANNVVGNTFQPMSSVQVPSLPVPNTNSRSNEAFGSTYSRKNNVLSDVTIASNNNNNYNAKRPVEENQENSLIPGCSKKIITSYNTSNTSYNTSNTCYNMSNPYTTAKK